MGNDEVQCEAVSPVGIDGAVTTPKPKVTNLTIKKHSNGYVVDSYGFETKVALTLDEALAFIKEEFDS